MTTPELSPLRKFQNLLGEMLQTEKSDLDFGIYRVVGQRRKEMDDFISQTIPNALKKAVDDAQPQNAALAEKEALEQKIRREVSDNAFTPEGELKPEFAGGDLGKQWRAVRERAGGARPLAEEDVCNRLLQFFARYYAEGDFVSKRRYAGQNEKYAVPYDGREVMLHWANRDQYYVKTADRFAQYAFQVNGAGAFQFRVEKTPAQKDNNKPPKGHFVLAEAREENGRVVAVFHRRELSEEEAAEIRAANLKGDRQTKILALAEKKINGGEIPALAPLRARHSAENGKSLFAVHAARFVRRNTSDYFIHRNLRAFLRRELDFFLKNEAINADELAENASAQNRVAAFRAVRDVARQVIEMLAQWENFQKSLWEKKKFVLQTEYCVALGKIPEWKTCGILECVADCEKQWAEWKALGMRGDSPDLFDNGKNGREKRLKFLRKHPSLPVDTKNFARESEPETGCEFKSRLLAQFSDIDNATDGVLIHGDNLQALNLLQETYRERVKCVYIDPPYNTGPSEILYKNNFKHSSWLSLIENRIVASLPMLGESGVYVVAIDENEQEVLGMLLSELFPERRRTCVTVVHNPSGQQSDNFSLCHENAYFVYPSGGRFIGMKTRDAADADIRPLRDVSTGNHLRGDAANCFYPIFVKDGEIIGFGDVCEDSFCPDGANVKRADGIIEVYPVDAQNVERKWVFARKNVESIRGELTAQYNKSRDIWDVIRTKTVFNHKTVWDEKKYSANSYGSKLLGNMGIGEFGFPKSVHTVSDCVDAALCGEKNAYVADYFAGSGTTAHAVVNLNREDGGRRKFILAEMGDYFHTILLPRVKKIIYSPEWKKGEAVRPATGEDFARGPSLVKYHRIESYEDALDNVEFERDAGLRGLSDFVPRYMLRWESRESPTFLSGEKLENPFDYGLVLSGEEPRRERADLSETFSYLIGLRVRRREVLTDAGTGRRYVVLRGESGGEETAVVWRDVSGWGKKDYERDAKFVSEQGWFSDAKRIFANCDSLIAGAEVLDSLFRERMFWSDADAEEEKE